MIRRDSNTGRWILIPQIAHARLAGDLAEHWGAAPFAPLEPRRQLLWATSHHDDGWAAWDANPLLDTDRGWLRSFTEMEIEQSLAIWSDSIETAERQGPLEAYLVAGHFHALAQRIGGWAADPARRTEAQEFLDHFHDEMSRWLASWQAQDPANTLALARRALAQLQMFDALSLWLCCTPTGDAEQMSTPDGPVLTLNPDAETADPQGVVLSPWPMDVERWNLEVQGREMPAGHYPSSAALAAAPSQSVRLRWNLIGPGQ
jgi:Protein of unknown function (DUF3891)